MINENHELPVKRQCELLGISRSSYYYKPVKPSKEELERKEEIMAEIDRIHTEMPYLGQRKIVKELKKIGINVGRKFVRSLMHEMGIYPIYPKPNLSKRNYGDEIMPYLLRNMAIYMPNQVWSIDITYIKLYKSHMYLTAIIDWHSRYIVGWNLSESLDTVSVMEAVTDAVSKHGTPGIINSDQGSQFTSLEYKELLKRLGIRQSMDGKSRWVDNVMVERWFRSLKTEYIYINEFMSPRALRRGIAEYVDQYNSRRPHAALGYQTPEEVFKSAFIPSMLLAS